MTDATGDGFSVSWIDKLTTCCDMCLNYEEDYAEK
jgi:hypothetical protein